MLRPLLHFAHANGFPAGTYSWLFDQLSDRMDVIHLDRMGHDPDFPIAVGWENQADELIAYLVRHADRPVIGAGHSLGATVSFLAAVKRPDLFRGLILLDPVLANGWRKYAVRLARTLGFVDRVSPAGKTIGRRNHWPDRASAESYFRSRSLYRNFAETSLQNFLKYGLEEQEDGFRLRFEVDREIAFYRTLPTHFDSLRGRLLDLPGVVITGDKTDVGNGSTYKRFTRQHRFEWKVVDGRHMFPLEQPEMTVQLIRNYALAFSGPSRGASGKPASPLSNKNDLHK